MKRYRVLTLVGGWPSPLKSTWTLGGAEKIQVDHERHSLIAGQLFWIEKRVRLHWVTVSA